MVKVRSLRQRSALARLKKTRCVGCGARRNSVFARAVLERTVSVKTEFRQRNAPTRRVFCNKNLHYSGGHLLSPYWTTIGPIGLTSVFGMETGVAL